MAIKPSVKLSRPVVFTSAGVFALALGGAILVQHFLRPSGHETRALDLSHVDGSAVTADGHVTGDQSTSAPEGMNPEAMIETLAGQRRALTAGAKELVQASRELIDRERALAKLWRQELKQRERRTVTARAPAHAAEAPTTQHDRPEDLDTEARVLQARVQELEAENTSITQQLATQQQTLDRLNQELASRDDMLLKVAAQSSSGSRQGPGPRAEIARRIVRALDKLQLPTSIDARTGKVQVYFQDSSFGHGQGRLSESAREVIRSLVPLYAEAVLGNKSLATSVTSIQVVGHASPTFNQRPIDPRGPFQAEAFARNLALSMQRASVFAEFMLSDDMGDFRFRQDLAQRLAITGRSHMDPVPSHRGSNAECGAWDCEKSRRIELSFSTADDPQPVIAH